MKGLGASLQLENTDSKLGDSFCTPRFLGRIPRDAPVLEVHTLVIGSGVAGLRAAIEAAPAGRVVVLAKDAFGETSTEYAQGGVAAVLTEEDSLADHYRDTLAVAKGVADPDRVKILVQEGPDRVQELLAWGGNFDRVDGHLALAMEGGHSRPRILRAGGDATGHEFQSLLTRVARRHESIEFAEYTFMLDLVCDGEEVTGAVVWDQNHGFRIVSARAVIVATGGIGQIYRETTNPPVATGDGLAAAFRAGAPLEDLEFVQFHPTTFYLAGAARRLISEAVRGEGAYLRDSAGERFMPGYHPAAELAPRDVVSRSILQQIRNRGDTNVFLDLTHLDGEAMKKRFPQLASLAQSYGLDIARDRIPVHPSAHYSIGGLAVDDEGRTPLAGLYACGEAAASGVHGANRLASNSLLECLVYGARAGRAAVMDDRIPQRAPIRPPPQRDSWKVLDLIERADMTNSIQSLMWRCAGIERDGERLEAARGKLAFWSQYVLRHPFPTPSGWEVQNLVLVSYLVVEAARRRLESRGVHFRTDHPERDDERFRCRLRLSNAGGGEIRCEARPVPPEPPSPFSDDRREDPRKEALETRREES